MSPPWLGKAVGCVLDEACSVRLALHHVQAGNQLSPILNKDGRCNGNLPWNRLLVPGVGSLPVKHVSVGEGARRD